MQSQTLNNEEKTSKTSKIPKTPIIYVATSIKNEVYNTLQEGLAHLDAKILDEEDFDKAIVKANIVILINENHDKVKKAWENGVVPITQELDPSVVDYNPNTESGNAFVYQNANEWEIFAAVVRALETHKFPYDWKFIVRSCKASA
ncbi:hypothetical protein ACFL3T_05210 [Patescibacteria group bacterium]